MTRTMTAIRSGLIAAAAAGAGVGGAWFLARGPMPEIAIVTEVAAQVVAAGDLTILEVPFREAVIVFDEVVTTPTLVSRSIFELDPRTGEREETIQTKTVMMTVFDDQGATVTIQTWRFKDNAWLEERSGKTFLEVTPTPTPLPTG